MFNMEFRYLLFVQNALDCISENFNLKNFTGGPYAPQTPQKSASFAVLMYAISLGPLYHKMFRPPLVPQFYNTNKV